MKHTLQGRFDVIQSCGAVEHVEDLSAFVRHVATLLKPGGHLVFTYEPEALRQAKRAPHIGTFGGESVFRRTPSEVAGLLTGAGLQIIDDVEFKAYIGLIHHLVIVQRG